MLRRTELRVLGPRVLTGTGESAAPPAPAEAERPPAAAPARWRHRRPLTRAAVALVLAAALGVVAASTVQARHQLHRNQTELHQIHDQFVATRTQLATTLADLSAAQQLRVGVSTQDNHLLVLLLQTAQQLGDAQAAQRAKAQNITDLRTCLDGVQAALNQVALHDPNGAVASLQRVHDSCAAAEAANA